MHLLIAFILYSILCLNQNFSSLKGAKLLRGNSRPTHAGTVTGDFNYQQAHTKFLSIRCYMPESCRLNPRTYRQSHTLTVEQWGGGGGGGGAVGVDGPPLFLFCLQWKPFDLLYKMKHILFVVALLEVRDVTKRGRHLVFFQELESR